MSNDKPLEPTEKDEADIAALNAPETETIFIRNRMDVALYEAADEKIGVALAMADGAFRELVNNNGGKPDTISFTVSRGVVDAGTDAEREVVVFVYSAERPLGWTAPGLETPDLPDSGETTVFDPPTRSDATSSDEAA